jgi:uncharacterized phage-associated protein
MDDSQAGRKLCAVSRQLGNASSWQLSALRHQDPEWIVRQVLTAFSYPQPVNEGSRFLELLHQ